MEDWIGMEVRPTWLVQGLVSQSGSADRVVTEDKGARRRNENLLCKGLRRGVATGTPLWRRFVERRVSGRSGIELSSVLFARCWTSCSSARGGTWSDTRGVLAWLSAHDSMALFFEPKRKCIRQDLTSRKTEGLWESKGPSGFWDWV